jgi:hypothetical protein
MCGTEVIVFKVFIFLNDEPVEAGSHEMSEG